MSGRRQPFVALQRVQWWLWLVMAALCVLSLALLRSTTQDDAQNSRQLVKQALFVVTGLGIGFFCLLPHYRHVRRLAFFCYGLSVLALLGLPLFGSVINGSRRWYSLPGISIQPSEFAKLGAVLGLAALLRFPNKERSAGMLASALLLAGLPAALVLVQPDLGSALVFVPIALAMSYAAGARGKHIGALLLLGGAAFLLAYFTVLHGYQKQRIDVWAQHWAWDEGSREVRDLLRGPAYQPWQALIAMGSGGLLGFGLGEGPQNRYAFLPYRSEDYIFAVVGEELGLLGSLATLCLYAVLVYGLLRVAQRTRERFGKLVCIGVAAWIGSQSLAHAAVCAWLLPSTGLPMPLLSYGGSSALATILAVSLCLNVSARQEPVLAGDGYA